MKISSQKPMISYIKQLGDPIFTTFELSQISGKSKSAVTQALNYLWHQGVVFKIYRGVWCEVGTNISAYNVIPFLFSHSRAYVSFISALHLYGIIEQVPQVITLASLSHTKSIKTAIATYVVHRIAPSFFDGFMWYKGVGNFLIAEPEKALVDSLYLSARKKRQYSYFPELNLSKPFSFKKVEEWVNRIDDLKIKKHVQKRLSEIKILNR